MNDLTEKTDDDGARDPNTGRFLAGNSYGQGNRSAKRLAEYRNAMTEAVSSDDLKRVAKALLARAIDGDVQAARLVLEYTLGKPRQEIEVEGDAGPRLVFNIVSAKRREVLDAD